MALCFGLHDSTDLPEISLGGWQMHHQEAYQSLLKLHIQKVQSPAFYFLNISPSLFFLSLITPNVSLRLLKKSSNWTLVSSLALILLTVHRKVCEGIQNVDWIMSFSSLKVSSVFSSGKFRIDFFFLHD